MKLLPYFGTLCIASLLMAQSEVRVLTAELSASFGAIAGKLVVQENTLTFVDLEKPESSFALDKSNVQSINRTGDALVVQLKKAVRDRMGETTRLTVRIAAPNESATVEQWLQQGVSAATAAPAKATDSERWSFPARRNKMIGGTDGTLIITPERVIFESLDKAEDTRRWELKEIKELKRKNPYQVEVIPFTGEKYDLKLSGTGMDNDQFRQLVDRIARERSARQ